MVTTAQTPQNVASTTVTPVVSARRIELVIDTFDQWSNPVGLLIPSRCWIVDEDSAKAAL